MDVYTASIVCVCFVQLHVEKGSGRFVPNPPFSEYVYARVIQRQKVSTQNSQKPFCYAARRDVPGGFSRVAIVNM